ncbi:serine/threonine protein kinase [Myxococcota bacterium]|nr:serine/threonine protein kinase [Myxococcota bacterium]MBU1429826.1 serine/threonine protein kinase [Myxococcota bacterium]MBU1898411.1 serine/threonine protein kinase [Myxococcota bacterium]
MTEVVEYLGPYYFEARLGRGGMGIVFRARHSYLGRPVAVKVRYLTRNAEEGLLFERFQHCAVLQSELNHPYVNQVFDYFEMPNFQALVMEYLGGGSVEDRIGEEGIFSIEEALIIGVQAALGLSYAHRRGIIHRDIKPGNLMFRIPGDVKSLKVSDFGVAKAPQRSPELTLPGANVGTLWYMPPEQFNGEGPTPLADVYALGVTLYEMLTGRVPFDSDDTSAIFSRFLDKLPPPDLEALNPLVGRPLRAVIEAAMALEIEYRVPSACALALLLRAAAYLEGLQVDGMFEPTENDWDILYRFVSIFPQQTASELEWALRQIQHKRPPSPPPTPDGEEELDGTVDFQGGLDLLRAPDRDER